MNEDFKRYFPELSDEQWKKAWAFREMMAKENEIQNLTRLISEEEFIDGHLSDVVELFRSGILKGKSNLVDVGSGGGVPGLLYCLLFGEKWILIDSERRKIEFLERAIEEFGLNGKCRAIWGRAEKKGILPEGATWVLRAVGSIEKLYRAFEKCSTWNEMICLKGPNWEEELRTARSAIRRFPWNPAKIREYSTPILSKQRVFLSIHAVPRGTSV